MSKWEECPLGDIIRLKRGYDLPHRERVDGKFPIISSSGISGFHKEAKVKGPGVVTGRYGTLGEIFYIPEDFWPLNTSLYVQNFKGNDPRFISYFLQTLGLGSQNIAGAVPGVNRNVLHKLMVRKPPLPVQRKIAAVLSAYDDLIANNTRRIALLEKMAEEIYREWFVRLRFPGHDQVIKELKKDKKTNKTLKEFCEFIVDCEHKTAPTQDEGYPSIRTPNIGRGRLLLDGVNRVSEETYRLWTNRAVPKPGDLILAREAPVGNVAVIPRGLKICRNCSGVDESMRVSSVALQVS